MLKIEVRVAGNGPSDKVGECLRDGLRDQMGATPWELHVRTTEGDRAIYTNEGRK